MKKRLHDKKAGIAILSALVVISLLEIIFRLGCLREVVFTTSNFGEQLATLIFAVIILVMTAKGKDRVCYLCYGAWAVYFVLDQFFELPGFVSNMLLSATVNKPMGMAVMILYVVSMIGIIGIGVLLVEYLNDGTICNKAFNILSIITAFAIIMPVFGDLWHIFMQGGDKILMLSVFNNLRRAIMIFLFTFFAYDSAKAQLKKVEFSK